MQAHYTDITYIHRRVAPCILLSSSTGDPSGFVVTAGEHDGSGIERRDTGRCLARHGGPEIFNTDWLRSIAGDVLHSLAPPAWRDLRQ